MPTVTTPDVTSVVDQRYFLAPLGGPRHPQSYLDRFPEEVYNKGLDSHLVKFLYAILGPSGAGWLRKNYLEARLLLEDFGIETFDLDKFYGDPLAFGRILEEVYDEDPRGLLPREKWEEIRAKDAKYRNRALDYVRGARAGNTPLGMALVARSGLGHEVEIIENYKHIYDQLSDDPLGIPKLGFTNSTEEMIVMPRREFSQSEVQELVITGSPTGGTFNLFFPTANESEAEVIIHWDASASVGNLEPVSGAWDNVQTALEQLPMIGSGNVLVSGGPLPDMPLSIQFTGDLGYRDVPKLSATANFTGGTGPAVTIATVRSGIDQSDELVSISPRDQRHLREALSRIKPVTTLVSYGKSPGLRKAAVWNTAFATSEYNEVVRFVTGQVGVAWPERDNVRWIERAVEHQAPRVGDDLQHHYRGFHSIGNLEVSSTHIGPFSSYQRALYPVLSGPRAVDFQFTADRATADYAEPLSVTANTRQDPPVQMVNGIYPTEYSALPGVPEIKYREEQFWASAELPDGEETLVIDLGAAQAVNYLYFETTRKPFDIAIEYDLLDMGEDRAWKSVTFDPDTSASTSMGYDPSALNPWSIMEYWMTNSKGQMIFTRYLRIRMVRRTDIGSPFSADTLLPFSIEVRNLRVGRNTA